MKKLHFALMLLLATTGFSQLPYSIDLFQYDSLMNVSYGSATDYAGNNTDLYMDIYKPKNDGNCLRPVLVLIHGGAWIGGDKDHYIMKDIARAFVKKGWVVASIDYRLGTHKTSSYTMYAACNTSISAPCGYISDSAEVYRANFRAMQDAKGAIRFMKSRNMIDSTDIHNVFVAGESAGGFIALAAGFTDQESEKHPSCALIGNAPTPDTDMWSYGCVPSTISYTRPDLGSIHGDLHLGVFDASVKGVGNFYGGVMDPAVFNQVADTPVVYLYHQGSDVVVHYEYGKLLGRMSWECYAQVNLCQTYYFYPYAFGSEGIHQFFLGQSSAPNYVADIVYNYNYMNDCLANGHGIDNPVRISNMINFFAQEIATGANDPTINCTQLSVSDQENSTIKLLPNPVNDVLYLHGDVSIESVEVYEPSGKFIQSVKLNSQKAIHLSDLNKGIYLLNAGDQIFRIVKN